MCFKLTVFRHDISAHTLRLNELISGVDDSNREVIDWCLETSDVEKKIRRAAKTMFRAINSTHQEVLSRAEYIDSVKKLAGGDRLEEKLLLAAGNNKVNG